MWADGNSAPQAVVITSEWSALGTSDEEPDEQAIIRDFTAALVLGGYDTELVVAQGERGKRVTDGGLRLTQCPSPPPQGVKASLLEQTAAALGGKQQVGRELLTRAWAKSRELRHPASIQAVDLIASWSPQIVVCTPSAQPTLRFLRPLLPSGTRVFLLVPSWSEKDAHSQPDFDLAEQYEALLIADDLDDSASDSAAKVNLGLPFTVGSRPTELFDSDRAQVDRCGHETLRYLDEAYVVVLADWPQARELIWPGLLGGALLGGLPKLALAFVGSLGITFWKAGTPLKRFPRPSRASLWKLISGSLAFVDLRQPSSLAREAMEAMLLGIPVIVPSSGGAYVHARRCSGGLWYDNGAELVDAVELVHRHPEIGRQLGANGLSHATSACVGPRAFSATVHSAFAAVDLI